MHVYFLGISKPLRNVLKISVLFQQWRGAENFVIRRYFFPPRTPSYIACLDNVPWFFEIYKMFLSYW